MGMLDLGLRAYRASAKACVVLAYFLLKKPEFIPSVVISFQANLMVYSLESRQECWAEEKIFIHPIGCNSFPSNLIMYFFMQSVVTASSKH